MALNAVPGTHFATIQFVRGLSKEPSPIRAA